MLLALVLLLVTGALLVRMQVRHQRRVAGERRGLLAGLSDLLEEPRLTQRGLDYPVLRGVHRGAPVIVSVIVDTMTMRQLPTLWLSVTRLDPLPLPGPVDLLLRPSATDIVSPGERFPVQHAIPADWPAYLRVATPAGAAPTLAALTPARPLLDDPGCKDVLLTPNGARVVSQLARARLGHYRLVKRAIFDVELSPEDLARRLDDVQALTDGIRQTAPAAG